MVLLVIFFFSLFENLLSSWEEVFKKIQVFFSDYDFKFLGTILKCDFELYRK